MSMFDRLFGRKREQPEVAEQALPGGGSPEPAPAEPPPPPSPTLAAPPAPIVPTPAPVAPERSLEDDITAAVDALVTPAPVPPPPPRANASQGTNGKSKPVTAASTAADLAALHATYGELSVEYCAPVRNVMIEVRWGEPPVRWLELVRGALGSLQAMATEVELGPLAAALERFNGVVGTVIRSGRTTVDAELRRKLLEAYAPLIASMPRAFDLEGERDRREPVILRCLLLMVPGMLPLAIDRCLAAGLSRVESIVKSPPADLAAVTGLDVDLCRRLVEVVRAEGRMGAGNPAEDRQRLQAQVNDLRQAHQGYEAAAASWGPGNRANKHRFREQREALWLRLQLQLAQLGEVDRIARLERLPFGRKIEDLESYLRTPAPVGSARARGGGGGRDRDRTDRAQPPAREMTGGPERNARLDS